jgi:hypothetical protein
MLTKVRLPSGAVAFARSVMFISRQSEDDEEVYGLKVGEGGDGGGDGCAHAASKPAVSTALETSCRAWGAPAAASAASGWAAAALAVAAAAAAAAVCLARLPKREACELRRPTGAHASARWATRSDAPVHQRKQASAPFCVATTPAQPVLDSHLMSSATRMVLPPVLNSDTLLLLQRVSSTCAGGGGEFTAFATGVTISVARTSVMVNSENSVQ